MDEFAEDVVRPSPFPALQERFGALWKRCVLPDVASSDAQVYERLSQLYSEPRRYYHGWKHVVRCLKQFDLAAGLMQDPDAVEMALWFHDAVYKPGAPDNEQQSADFFVGLASGQFPGGWVAKIRDLILWTTHLERPSDSDGCLVVDIDLSSLGSSWRRFLRDSERIRNEFDGVPGHAFHSAQIRVLQSLLAREQVFYSDFFHRHCERRARRNVTRLIARLQR